MTAPINYLWLLHFSLVGALDCYRVDSEHAIGRSHEESSNLPVKIDTITEIASSNSHTRF